MAKIFIPFIHLKLYIIFIKILIKIVSSNDSSIYQSYLLYDILQFIFGISIFIFFQREKKKTIQHKREEKSQKSLHINNTFHHQMIAWMERVNESNFNFLLTQASPPPPLDTIRTRSFVSARRCMQRVCYQSSRRSSKTMRPRASFSTLINSFTKNSIELYKQI